MAVADSASTGRVLGCGNVSLPGAVGADPRWCVLAATPLPVCEAERIMDHTGHASIAMVRVYTRRSDAFADHAGAGLL